MEKIVECNNGVPIYYYCNEHVHSFCICLYIKAGVLYEKKEYNGVTHFWEHMVFKNINHNMKGKMSKALDKIGAYFNGTTFKEMVEFKITGASKNFKPCAKIISKVMLPAEFTDKELETEKRRIKSEIREDDEENSIDFLAEKYIWRKTGLAMPITGTASAVDGFNKKSYTKTRNRILDAKNMFFYVTGAFTDEDIEYLKKLIDICDIGNDAPLRMNIAPVPKKFFKRKPDIKIVNADKDEIRFSFDFDAGKYTVAQIDLLYDILFDGECCKIFKSLSDKSGLIYSYNSMIEQYKNIGCMSLAYEVKEKRLLESVEKVILIFKKLKKGIKDELEYVKPVYIDNAEMELDIPDKLNWTFAYESHILGQDYKDIHERRLAHVGITAECIEEMVNDIFTTSNLSIMIRTTNKKLKSEEVEKIVSKL